MKTIKLSDQEATQLVSILKYAFKRYQESGDKEYVELTIQKLITTIRKQTT